MTDKKHDSVKEDEKDSKKKTKEMADNAVNLHSPTGFDPQQAQANPATANNPPYGFGNSQGHYGPQPTEKNPNLQSDDNPGAPQVPFDGHRMIEFGEVAPGSNPGTHKAPEEGTEFGSTGGA